MLVYRYAYNIPGSKPVVEPPKLVVRNINGKTMYWNYSTGRWTRLTRRCPYLV